LTGDILQRVLGPVAKVGLPDRLPHARERRLADRGSEAPEQAAPPGVLHQPWPKAIPQEVKRLIGIAFLATPILALDDFGLCRMHLQTAFGQTKLKLGHDDLRLLLTPAVYQSIVCIPTPRKLRVCPCHPQIERIVQEQIGQYGTDQPSHNLAKLPFDLGSVKSLGQPACPWRADRRG